MRGGCVVHFIGAFDQELKTTSRRGGAEVQVGTSLSSGQQGSLLVLPTRHAGQLFHRSATPDRSLPGMMRRVPARSAAFSATPRSLKIRGGSTATPRKSGFSAWRLVLILYRGDFGAGR